MRQRLHQGGNIPYIVQSSYMRGISYQVQLQSACFMGHVDTVQYLLAKPADQNGTAPTSAWAVDLSCHDSLCFRDACQQGHFEIVQELLAVEGERAVDVHAEQTPPCGKRMHEGIHM